MITKLFIEYIPSTWISCINYTPEYLDEYKWINEQKPLKVTLTGDLWYMQCTSLYWKWLETAFYILWYKGQRKHYTFINEMTAFFYKISFWKRGIDNFLKFLLNNLYAPHY